MKNIIGFLILMTGAVISGPSLDLGLELADSYKQIGAGDNLWFTMLVNCSHMDIKDESVLFSIENSGEVLVSVMEKIPLCREDSILAKIQTPKVPGKYELHARALDSEAIVPITVTEAVHLRDIYKDSLFDIILEIPERYRIVAAGDQMLASIKLINIGSAGRIDVFLEYLITGPEGVVLSKRETVAVETQANFVRTFDLSDDLKPGNYKLSAQIVYADGRKADSELSFLVIEQSKTIWYYVAAGIVSMVILLGILKKLRPAIKRSIIKRRVARIIKKRAH